MRTLIIAAAMLIVSAAAFSQPNTKAKQDTTKKTEVVKPLPAFPINENNALPLLNLLASYDQLLGNQTGLIISGNDIQQRRQAIASYQQLVKQWADEVQQAQAAKAKEPPKK